MELFLSSRVHIPTLERAMLLAAGWMVICAPTCWANEDTSVLDVTKQAPIMPMESDVRLRGGTQPWEGRIEIYSQSSGQWHTHCNTPRREEFYHAVCRTLGFGAFVRDLGVEEFEKSSLVPLPGHFECNKDAIGLRNCFFKEGEGCGSNEEEVGIVCSGVVSSCGPISFNKDDHRVMDPFKLSYPAGDRLNSICKGDRSMSAVMKCVNGNWEWEGEEPQKCPRIDDSIRCPAPFIDIRNTFLQPWKLTYQYDVTLEIVCLDRSNTTRLRCGDGGRLECVDGGKGCIPEVPTCQTPSRTLIDEKIILVGGDKPNKGRVLVNRDGQWGSICADGWNLVNADVICTQLGFGPARDLVQSTSPRFPPGSKQYLFREVGCTSSDTNILGCSSKYMLTGDKCLSDLEVEVDCFINDVIDCGKFCYMEMNWMIAIGIGIVSLQVVIFMIIVTCCCTRRLVPTLGEKDRAPPPNNEVKLQPIAQQPVRPQRRPQADNDKLEFNINKNLDSM